MANAPAEAVDITLDMALRLYGLIFGISPQQAHDQLRSIAALEGALVRPVFYQEYERADFARMAAVLAHGIAERQPFLDGNKRLAFNCPWFFLAVNGYTLDASDQNVAAWTLELSQNLNVDGLAALLASHLRDAE
ncbi:MAG: type II toxin-antitoxin system death-on-curing family toxin [Chloroflexota bacterium]